MMEVYTSGVEYKSLIPNVRKKEIIDKLHMTIFSLGLVGKISINSYSFSQDDIIIIIKKL